MKQTYTAKEIEERIEILKHQIEMGSDPLEEIERIFSSKLNLSPEQGKEEELETAKCKVCHKLFERDINRPEGKLASCPAHSFGDVVETPPEKVGEDDGRWIRDCGCGPDHKPDCKFSPTPKDQDGNEELKGLLEEIENKTKHEWGMTEDIRQFKTGFNQALQEVAEIIKDRINQ